MNKKTLRFLEIIWLVVAILSVIAGIHKTYTRSLSESYPFFIITGISFLMYFYRRNMRIKRDKQVNTGSG